MKNLNTYIDQMNTWNGFFGTAPVLFPLTQADVDAIAQRLDSELSPENLHCDGEISASAAQKKYNYYGKVIKELEDYCLYNVLGMPKIYEYY